MRHSDKPGILFWTRNNSPYSLSPAFIWHIYYISEGITQSSSDLSVSCDLSHLHSALVNTILRGLGHSQVSSVVLKLWCTSLQDSRRTHSVAYKWGFGHLPLHWCPIQKCEWLFFLPCIWRKSKVATRDVIYIKCGLNWSNILRRIVRVLTSLWHVVRPTK
jgi:hypothetical protein